MKNFSKYIFNLTAFLSLAVFIVACSQSEPNDSPFVGPDEDTKTENPAESTILIYAVATNSLSSNLVSDKQEMLQAAKDIDLSKNNVLIFQTKYEYDESTYNYTGNGDVSLIKLVKDGNDYLWERVKEYSTEIAPLNPVRISEVIDYVNKEYPAKNNGLIFWSHSTGSQPFVAARSVENLPSQYSFGQDKTTEEAQFEQINVDLLAAAVPSGVFDFIWFDSCYMSNIETIYQFRDKCKTYVAYPTEVLEYGMPYDLVLPQLIGSGPDLNQAAETFFKYYAENSYSSLRIATVAVIDMARLDILADFCQNYYMVGNDISNVSGLIKYTRYTTGPFYDLGDYTKAMALGQGYEISDSEWDTILNQCVTYKAATPYDFAGKAINPDKYSGISTHIYDFKENSTTEQYYMSLDWFKATFN